MHVNRNRLEIYDAMLRVAKVNAGARKSHLVYKANLNFEIIKGYLRELLNKGLLRQTGSFYKTTEKGQDYRAKYRQLLDVIA